MAEVRWTPQETEDLESIAAFITQDSPHYAGLFVLNVIRRVELLKTFPRRGRVVPETNSEQIRELLMGNYRIVYRFRDNLAEILTIYHGSRLLNPDIIK